MKAITARLLQHHTTPVQMMMTLFDGSDKKHGEHKEPDPRTAKNKYPITKSARTIPGPATEALWNAHLGGTKPLGVIPIRDDGSCKWGSIDIDEYDTDFLDVIKRIESVQLPLVPCRSKSGGLHLFLFLKEPAQASDVQAALKRAAVMLGMDGVEIFPKQTHLEPGASGNWMCMPYLGTTFDGKLKKQHGLKKTGAEMTLGEFVQHSERKRTDLDKFTKLFTEPMHPRAQSRGEFNNGPPCLQRLTTGEVQSDGRKRTLFMMALYYKRAAGSEWKERLEQANRLFFSPPLASEEVVGVIKSVGKKDYEYTCKEEPMRSFCDSRLCRTRQFGVGEGSGAPVIVRWRKISSENPVWYITIDGSKDEMEINKIEDITNYQKFSNQCAKQLNRFFPNVKQGDWANILNDAASKLEDTPASEDITREGAFFEHLEEFLTNRMRGERREDILSGRPWMDEDKQRYEFTMAMVERHLLQSGMRATTRHECGQWIKKHGGGRVSKTPTTISGKGVRLWFVPTSAIQATPEIDPPKLSEREI